MLYVTNLAAARLRCRGAAVGVRQAAFFWLAAGPVRRGIDAACAGRRGALSAAGSGSGWMARRRAACLPLLLYSRSERNGRLFATEKAILSPLTQQHSVPIPHIWSPATDVVPVACVDLRMP